MSKRDPSGTPSEIRDIQARMFMDKMPQGLPEPGILGNLVTQHPELTESPKLCECGCGKTTLVAKKSNSRLGHIKGQPLRYIRGHSGGLRGRTVEQRFWAMVRKGDEPDACWVWTGALNNKGYGQIRIGGKCVLAHRASFEIAYGSISGDINVLHHCDNPPCIRPDHLFLGTLSDNSIDMVQKGRRVFLTGTAYRRKLSDPQVLEIRLFYTTKQLSPIELAVRYGVTPTTIRDIGRGKTWRNLK